MPKFTVQVTVECPDLSFDYDEAWEFVAEHLSVADDDHTRAVKNMPGLGHIFVERNGEVEMVKVNWEVV